MSKPEPACETARQVHDHCLCLQAQRAARALARRFDEAFRPLGLTSGQFSLLMSLNRLEPPGLGSVAALLAMDRTTLTAALKPLQRRKLVEVKPDERDKRNRRLSLTAEGRSLLAAALPVWRCAHAEVDGLVGGDIASVDEVAPGSGGLLSRGMGLVAVYRDEAGTVHQCSAVCPHLGCIVHWNAAEQTWDCPCHGSRFDKLGKVINGPANTDLPPVEGG